MSVGIVGGGVAGLSAAALLARKGIAVDLFETNAKVGGCCATTNLDGYTFNDGALYVAIPGLLDHVFERIALDRASVLPLRKITAPQTATLPDGTSVTFGDGLDIDVAGATPVDRARLQRELAAFMRRWEPVLDLFAGDLLLHPLSLPRLVAKGWRQLHKLRGTVSSELTRTFSSSAVRAAMSGTLLYTGYPPDRMPSFSLLGLVTLFRDGFFLPEGGMGKVSEALRDAVLKNGGRIHLNSGVRKILVQRGQARGLELGRPGAAGTFECDAVISTVSAMHTFGTLMDPGDVPAGLLRKFRHANLSRRASVLQLGLTNRIDVPSHGNYVLPMMEGQHEVFEPSESVRWPVYSVPTASMPELAAAGGSIVEMFPPIDRDIAPVDWTDAIKQAVADRAIESLRRRHRIDIAVQRMLSPKEFQDSLHLYAGAIYGLSPVGSAMALFEHQTPIRGLFQAGQTTWPGFGVAPSAVSGILAAEAALERATV